MVEGIVLWNEPNNLSHWNFKLDPGWERFADMVMQTSSAIRRIKPELSIILGGVSSCDCDFLRLMTEIGVMTHADAVGVHGFPLDWNHWQLSEWPKRIAEAIGNGNAYEDMEGLDVNGDGAVDLVASYNNSSDVY